MYIPPDFLERLQDPKTKEGFWNVFSGTWGVAQSQPAFNPQDWLNMKAYIEELERKLELRV
jgi:hypothetical protein